jgi:hypothetical protein
MLEGRGRGGPVGRGGGAIAPSRGVGPAVAPYGTRTVTNTSRGTVVGPGGGTIHAGAGSGSTTTKGGTTINYGGAGAKGTTPGGISAGKGVGGMQITTPDGKTYTKVGSAGGAIGPGGNAVAGKSSIGVGSGPGGTIVTGNKSGVAIGPGGAAGYKGGAVVGPYNSAAGFSRYGVNTAGAVGHRTTYVNGNVMRTQAVAVRGGFVHYNCFNRGWYANHPRAWRPAAWNYAAFWTGVAWGALASGYGYPAEPVYFDYGTTIVYEGDTVYVQGEKAATADQYAQQAETIAATGKDAKADEKDDWQALGVFAMIQGDEKDANNIFQLAINKDSVIRGNYYNGLTDSTVPVFGAVDKKTMRAAWTVGERKDVVYETGLANLTQPETAMLVHFGRDRTQQWMLVRMEPQEDRK